MLKMTFQQILDNYQRECSEYNRLLDERKEKKRIGELSPYSVVSQSEYLTPQLLKTVLPNEMASKGNISQGYKIKGSAGNGYMPEVPHVCLFDTAITASAQTGYYIVYLFDLQSKKVFLSLNQGFTQYRNKYGNILGRNKIRQNAVSAQKVLRSVFDFELEELPMVANGDLAEGYKRGNICSKTYDYLDFPEDAQLLDDLRNLIGVYRELKGLVGNSIFEIKVQTTENEYQADIQGKKGKALPPGPIMKRAASTGSKSSVRYNRDTNISAQALITANYKCENDPKHSTFITRFGHQFVEAHHLVPLEFQEQFEFSLDVPENIISLCPNCHRAFHHSNPKKSYELISKFIALRYKDLKSRGIIIESARLSQLYNIINSFEMVI